MRALTALSVLVAAALSAPATDGAGGAGLGPGGPPIAVPSSATKLLGQRIMVSFPGIRASPALLSAVRAGGIGGVILFGGNIASRAQVRALARSLQTAARQGHNPPLLIATDQEGGQVRRFAGAPPTVSPPQMVRTGPPSIAASQGRATGRFLQGVGVNVDLAPVADVPTFGGAFIWQEGRAFSFKAGTVARYATAFASGLQGSGVAATAKHFPGLGTAAVSTDVMRQELHPSAAQRAAALVPYRSLIAGGVDLVMVGLAGYPAYDPSGTPAALSSRIIGGLLRRQLGFGGVTITDSLGAPTGHDERTAGVLAARAGADVLLFSDSAPGELAALRAALASGRLSRAAAATSYRRIVALKQQLTG